MKKNLMKMTAVLLAVLLTAGLAVPAFAGMGGNYTAPVPTVYLRGQGFVLYADKNDTKSERIHDVDIPDGYVGDAAKEMIGPLMRGLTLNQWDTYCDMLVEAVAKVYEKQALDNNGEASNGSGVNFSSGKSDRKNADGSYNLGSYTPDYDWRLDPCVTADELNTYIGQIKAATKKDKVNLIGRSIGASVLMAYLEKYGMDDIETAVLYCPSFYGMEVFSRAFAGKIKIDSDKVDSFVSWYVESGKADGMMGDENDDLLDVLMDFVSASARYGTLDLTAGLIQRIFKNVYQKVYPQLLVKMYGSMPSFWSLVGDEDYEDAKKLIFGDNREEYAGLIEKIDNFHYNVLLNAENRVKELSKNGGKIQIVVKCGVPMVPLVEDANKNSDMLTSVWSASAGAECAPLGQQLPADYQMSISRKGLWKYLSPEKDIDASAGVLPDHTWYIKNLDHRDMPESVNVLFEAILNFDGYTTVFDLADFPQYLYYDQASSTLSPLTAPAQEAEVGPVRAFFTRIRNYFRDLFIVLRKIFKR